MVKQQQQKQQQQQSKFSNQIYLKFFGKNRFKKDINLKWKDSNNKHLL